METIIHNNPSDYGLTKKEADKMQKEYLKSIKPKPVLSEEDAQKLLIKYLKDQVKAKKEFSNMVMKHYIKSTFPLGKALLYAMIKEVSKEIEVLERRIYYIKNRSNKDRINIETVKAIPIKNVMTMYGYKEIARNRYQCPVHEEKTGSFFIREKENRGKCFGCGAYLSTVDIVIAKENCTISEAIKKLANIT